MGDLEISSTVAVEPEVVWRHALDVVGVNREFRPFLRMTFPAGVENLTAGWQPGRRQFRSWIVVAGLLPLEYDDVVFEEVEPGRRFLERSSMLSQRVWEHERVVEPVAGGCRVTDRVHFEPRLALMGPLYAPIFRVTFRWRHRQLQRIFGEVHCGGS